MMDFGTTAGIALGGVFLFLPAWAWARRRRRVALKEGTAAPPAAVAAAAPKSGGKAEARLAAMEAMQADMAARLDALASERNAPEEKLQAMAGQLLSVIRDKNATFETALAGLEQLRGRMRSLEEIGELAESREMIDALEQRIGELKSDQAAGAAALEVRLAALEASDGSSSAPDFSEQLAQIYARKDEGLETMLTRLAPLETRLAELEGRAPGQADMARLEEKLAGLQKAQGGIQAELAGVKAGAGAAAEIAGRLEQIHAKKEALSENVLARLEAVERDMAERDPAQALGHFARRLDTLMESHASAETALKERIAALENADGNPFADISEQLSRLYAQKDGNAEAVFARLAPLEARLKEIETAVAEFDPQASEDGLAARVESLQSAGAASEAGLKERITRLANMHEETRKDLAGLRAEARTAAVLAERLERLHSQREALAESVLTRMGALEKEVAAQNPQEVLDRFAERLEAMKEARLASETALKDRLEALESADGPPYAEITEQLTQLYAQKDLSTETMLARLAPLEAKLAELEQGLADRDPAQALSRFSDRLDAMKEARVAAETALKDRLEALESADGPPYAEITEQLTQLYAQKDLSTETMLARLAPLEAKLTELEQGLADRDPAQALSRFAERLDAMKEARVAAETALKERLEALESADPHPYAEITEQLTQLYAQKDISTETMLARLAPLEAKLAELEQGLAAHNPQEALNRFAERLEAMKEARLTSETALKDRLDALENTDGNLYSEITGQLTQLYAQKDLSTEMMLARLAPLEEKLAELEQGLAEHNPAQALDRFAERLEAMKDARIAAETALKDRLDALENTDGNPYSDITEQLAQLYAQKDLSTEMMLARLAPLETKLTELERGLAARDPQDTLDRFAERLEAMKDARIAAETALKDRLEALENSGDNPYAEITEQLTQLYAQKDLSTETMLTRLAPLEAKLAELEGGLGELGPLARAGADAPERIAGIAARLDALDWAQDEVASRLEEVRAAAGDKTPYTDITEQLTRLYAQKEASVEAVIAKLAPIEARLAKLEEHPWDPEAAEARAQAQTIAAQMAAARAAAEHTELFANRLALLESSLPRLSAAQTVLMQTLESGGNVKALARQVTDALKTQDEDGKPAEAADSSDETGPEAAAESAEPAPETPEPGGQEMESGGEDDMDEVWSMPQLVSLHRK